VRKTKHIMGICLLILVLIIGSVVNVYADDSEAVYNGNGDFSFGPGTAVSSTTLFNEFENLMPGDTVEQNITVSNNSNERVNIYLRAVPHNEENPLATKVKDTETIESMEEFLSHLDMTVQYEGNTIFHSSPEKPAQLAENYFLGTFRKNDSRMLKVTLKVPAELGNDYMARAGEVDWVFRVERFEDTASIAVDQGVTSKPGNGEAYQAGETVTYSNTVTNNGNVTLLNVEVVEALTGKTVHIDRLAPGESYTFTTTYTVTQQDAERGYINNSLSGIGTPEDPTLDKVSDTDKTVVKTMVAGGSNTQNNGKEDPQTGDDTVLFPYLVLFMGALGTLIRVAVKRKE